jgi:hypothetical protein
VEKRKPIKYIPLYVRLEESSYRSLRKMAYLNEKSMADITREAIEDKIKEAKKVLTNADIAI